MGGKIDEPALRSRCGDHGSDAHVEVGVGLGLGVHAGEAVNEAGNDEFSRAVDDLRAFGNGDSAGRANVGDAALVHDHDGVLEVACRVAPVGDIHNGAAGEHQGNRRRSDEHRRLCDSQHGPQGQLTNQ